MKVFGDKNDVTLRKDKTEVMQTEYGTLDYKAWCLREVKRLGARKVRFKENRLRCWVEAIK